MDVKRYTFNELASRLKLTYSLIQIVFRRLSRTRYNLWIIIINLKGFLTSSLNVYILLKLLKLMTLIPFDRLSILICLQYAFPNDHYPERPFHKNKYTESISFKDYFHESYRTIFVHFKKSQRILVYVIVVLLHCNGKRLCIFHGKLKIYEKYL